MKWIIKSILCGCALYIGTVLPVQSTYSATQAEDVRLASHHKIKHIEQKGTLLIVILHTALTKQEKEALQKAVSTSYFLKGVQYHKGYVELQSVDSVGYVYTASSATLRLFHDSLVKRTHNNIQPVKQSKNNTVVSKGSPSRKHTQVKKTTITPIAQSIASLDLNKQMEIIERRREVRQSNVHEVRDKIYRDHRGIFERIFMVSTANAQGTGKVRINMGGPEDWYKTLDKKVESVEEAKSNSSVKERVEPIVIEDRITTVPEDNDSNDMMPPIPTEQHNIQDIEKRAEQEKNKGGQQTVSPSVASENAALVQSEEEKEKLKEFEVKKKTALSLLNRKEYKKALDILQGLSKDKMSKTEKEELLYLIADISEVLSREDSSYIPEAITNFYVAMNFNLASEQVPNALLQLGLLNGAMNNTKETEAYFSLIRKKYPKDKNVPLTYYYLGQYYQKHKQYSKALTQYKILEEEYPQFEYLREVIVSIIQCLDALQYYKDIKPYTAFIDGRWPTLYQTYPDILLAKAKMYFDLKEYAPALDSYWQYVNIVPKAEGIDMIYAHIGDSYLHLNQVEKARTVYKNIVQKYNNTEGYVLAKIRLAEDTVIDDITDDAQFLSVFDRSFSTHTRDTYMDIINNHKDSAFTPIAQAKLAMWYFWMKDYNNALDAIDTFKQRYPESNLMPSIHKLLSRVLYAVSQDKEKKKTVPALWNKYHTLFTEDESLQPEHRLSIAQALADDAKYTETAIILQPFFKGRRYQDISEKAVLLALDINQKTKNWKGIEDLYYRVLDWELPRNVQSQLLYDTALAFNTMEAYDKADTLFNRLLSSVFTSPYYKGMSAYYIAKNGLRALQPPSKVYPFAKESLNSLLLASKEKTGIQQSTLNNDIIASLTQLRSITKKLGAIEDSLRYTILQEQYEPNNLLLQIEKAKLLKQMGNIAEWKRILEDIITKNPDSSYAKLAKAELIAEENKNSLRSLGQ